MLESVAEVLLEQGVGGGDRVLTYRVPAVLSGAVKPGVRVVVPVGRREVAGLVLRMDAELPAATLRAIRTVLDPTPLVTVERAVLADWLSFRCFSRRCDAWRLFLPPGVARLGRRRLALAVPRPLAERRLTRFILPVEEAARLQAAITALARGDRRPEQLQLELGPLYRQIEIMLGEGYLAWREPWQRKRPGARQISFVRLTGTVPARPTPKQEKILAHLTEKPGGSAARAELLAACGVGRSVLDRLISIGCLAAEERIIRRVPGERGVAGIDRIPSLTPAQEAAVGWVRARLEAGGAMLLHGITGSGKTEVYLRAIAEAVACGRRGLLLVPEIGLTPQMVERVVARFGDRVAVLHSRLSIGERLDEWERIQAGMADVVVGPRSALFAPLDKLGVVVLDEEHDQAYKQEDGLRYHARDAARELCRLSRAVLILGSATPSMEAMEECARGEAVYFALPERPGGRPLPPVELVDLRGELRVARTGALSQRLRQAMAACLAEGGQAILLLNRRGYATFVLCRECGHAMRCPHCDVSLTYHQGQTVLLCHYCGYTLRVPDICPHCRGRYIHYFGLGTERLCEEVAGFFPGARVARMDQDAMAHKGAHQETYRALRTGAIDILVGTQMVAKGLDLPRVTLVGVVAADAGLNRPDFRAAERTFQLLAQVAGRAGRGDQPGLVVIQTYNPGHYSLTHAARHDYLGFHQIEREVRRAAGYPPFSEMVRVGLTGSDEGAVRRAADALAHRLRDAVAGAGEILGPSPALVKKVEDRYRYHFLIKTAQLNAVAPTLAVAVQEFREARSGTRVTVVLDVNPNTVL